MSEEGGGRGGLLGGRFAAPVDDEMRRFSSSLDIDLRMLDEDVDGSLAHAAALADAGVLDPDEARAIRDGLERVRGELAAGTWSPDAAHEDVHMAVEARLTELIGEVGKKLHTGRSRNDQVATDVRLWLKRRLTRIDAAIVELAGAMLDRVGSQGRTLMPGYTHLQRGQPILLGHHLLAHVWPLLRDRGRFTDAARRLDRSPLGAAALAGTSFALDRRRTADRLGFGDIVENAMDAVAGRDHEQEVAAACAICMTHLSRMAEELVLWSSSEFAFVGLGEGYTTGSSIMPQKSNPDAAELVRGKTARVHGHLMTLLGLTKSLPLAYNRDLQEGREPLFDTVDTTLSALRISGGMWHTLRFARERFADELAGDLSLATELADLLADRGVPFREAHAAVGRLVRRCEELGTDLAGLDPETVREIEPRLPGDLGPWLDPRAATERRRVAGGTAWSEVERQVEALRDLL